MATDSHELARWNADRTSIRIRVQPVQRLFPSGQHLTRTGIDVGLTGPDRESVDVDGLVAGWPPQRHVGAGHDWPQDLPGDDPPDRGVQMGGEAALGFEALLIS